MESLVGDKAEGGIIGQNLLALYLCKSSEVRAGSNKNQSKELNTSKCRFIIIEYPMFLGAEQLHLSVRKNSSL